MKYRTYRKLIHILFFPAAALYLWAMIEGKVLLAGFVVVGYMISAVFLGAKAGHYSAQEWDEASPKLNRMYWVGIPMIFVWGIGEIVVTADVFPPLAQYYELWNQVIRHILLFGGLIIGFFAPLVITWITATKIVKRKMKEDD